MNTWLPVLAQLEVPNVTRAWHATNGTTRELLALFGAIAAVTGIVVVWVIYFRKPKRRRRVLREGTHHASSEGNQGEAKGRSRRRRRRSAAMNPTLAQTGGLPPARVEVEEPETARAE